MSRERRNVGQGAAWFIWYVISLVLMVALAFVVPRAEAQTVPGSLTLRWTLPTTGCLVGISPPVCDQPLTGNAALTNVRVWISTSPIPDTPTGSPALTLAAGATTATHTMQVMNGQTLYARMSVRNAANESALTPQVTKPIAIDVRPGVPTNVTIELLIGASP